jgi:hypothetical protein
MREDLLTHLVSLQAEAERLQARRERIEKILEDHTPQLALEQEAHQLQHRIRRLETLERGGRSINREELATLEATFTRHVDSMEATDSLIAQQVQATARLLEIGTVANEVRRELFSSEVTQSLDTLVAQVRAEVLAGKRAAEEVQETVAPNAVEEAERRLDAARAQRLKARR